MQGQQTQTVAASQLVMDSLFLSLLNVPCMLIRALNCVSPLAALNPIHTDYPKVLKGQRLTGRQS